MARSLAVLILLAIVTDASACSCAEVALEEEVQNAAAIFVGKVVRLEVTDVAEGVSSIEATIDVTRSFKGSVGWSVVLTTSDGCCYCAPWFEIARTYVFYTFRGEDGALRTNACSRTKVVDSRAEEELKLLEQLCL